MSFSIMCKLEYIDGITIKDKEDLIIQITLINKFTFTSIQRDQQAILSRLKAYIFLAYDQP